MSADSLGKRLVREIEEERLDEVCTLHEVKLQFIVSSLLGGVLYNMQKAKSSEYGTDA